MKIEFIKKMYSSIKNMFEFVCTQHSKDIKLIDISDEEKNELIDDSIIEEWKPIENTKYKVSNKGRVMGTKILSPECSDGKYLRVLLSSSGKRDHRFIHILVANAFLTPPEDESKKFIDHVDNNSKNNNSSNLRWVNQIENNNSRRKVEYVYPQIFLFKNEEFVSVHKKFSDIGGIMAFDLCENILRHLGTGTLIGEYCWYSSFSEQLPNEEWRLHEETKIQVSNFGRIKTSKGCSTGTTTSRYPRYKENMIHIMVLEAFVSEKHDLGSQGDHINQIKHDNRVVNLRWLSPRHNSLLGNQSKNKAVVQMKDGVIVNVFQSMKDASIAVETSGDNIWMCVTGRSKSAKGFEWRYATEEEQPLAPKEYILNKETLSVSQYKKGVLIAMYSTIDDASKNTGISVSYIRRCCRGDRKTAGGYEWKHE